MLDFIMYKSCIQKSINLIVLSRQKCILGMQNVDNWSNVRRGSLTSFWVDSIGGTKHADSSYILHPNLFSC